MRLTLCQSVPRLLDDALGNSHQLTLLLLLRLLQQIDQRLNDPWIKLRPRTALQFCKRFCRCTGVLIGPLGDHDQIRVNHTNQPGCERNLIGFQVVWVSLPIPLLMVSADHRDEGTEGGDGDRAPPRRRWNVFSSVPTPLLSQGPVSARSRPGSPLSQSHAAALPEPRPGFLPGTSLQRVRVDTPDHRPAASGARANGPAPRQVQPAPPQSRAGRALLFPLRQPPC